MIFPIRRTFRAEDHHPLISGMSSDTPSKRIFNNDDVHVYADLIDLLKDYNKIVEQTILLEDKLKLYGDDMASYDVHINEFWIL